MDKRTAGLVYSVHFPGVVQPIAVVALTHPANRCPNVKRRLYKGQAGDDAEMAMLHDALGVMRVGGEWQVESQ